MANCSSRGKGQRGDEARRYKSTQAGIGGSSEADYDRQSAGCEREVGSAKKRIQAGKDAGLGVSSQGYHAMHVPGFIPEL
eukprot:1161579-Pelagomonas_calceolata.AAC.17